MADIVIPGVGVGMTEALILTWLKEPGDSVAADEPVVEIETDKATMELVSPCDGTLGPHLFEPGAVVEIGKTVAVVLTNGLVAPAEPPAAGPPVVAAVAVSTETAPPLAGQDEGARRPHASSPRARRLAEEAGQPAAAAVPQAERFRELIAAKVSESWRQIPHFAVTREVDCEPMDAALAELRAAGTDPKPTLTDLLLHALAEGLRETGHENPGDVGLAVATPHGVVIPVVRGVLDSSPSELAQSRADAVERALAGRLSPSDLEVVPASTLSNLGGRGVDQFTGIIALGQASLLTVGRAIPRVVPASDGRSFRLGKTFHATLNADHRTYDGAGAANLLVAFADSAEGTPRDGRGGNG